MSFSSFRFHTIHPSIRPAKVKEELAGELQPIFFSDVFLVVLLCFFEFDWAWLSFFLALGIFSYIRCGLDRFERPSM